MSLTRRQTIRHVQRTVRNSVATAGLVIFMAVLVSVQNDSLWHASFFTGYTLFCAILFLAAYKLRKRLTTLPLGQAKTWLQLHVYVGISTFFMFGLHTGFRIPTGWLESILALLFLLVSSSGMFGLYLCRAIPKRQSAVAQEFVYERTAAMRHSIARRAKDLALQSAEATNILARLYLTKLVYFFERPRSLWYFAWPTGHQRRALQHEVANLERYLNQDQRLIAQQIATLIQDKDDIDFHWTMQGRLKLWPMVHVGLTYSLLLVTLVHVVLAHAFFGGWR